MAATDVGDPRPAASRSDTPSRAGIQASAAALPPDLRPAFLERGQLVIALAH